MKHKMSDDIRDFTQGRNSTSNLVRCACVFVERPILLERATGEILVIISHFYLFGQPRPFVTTLVWVPFFQFAVLAVSRKLILGANLRKSRFSPTKTRFFDKCTKKGELLSLVIYPPNHHNFCP